MHIAWFFGLLISHPMCMYCGVYCSCMASLYIAKFGILLVVAALILILLCIYQYFTFLFPYTQTLYEANPVTIPFGLAFIAAWLSVNVVFNYVKCVTTSAKFVKDEELDNELVKTMYPYNPDMTLNDDQLRYCHKCKIYKPWRAKHCSKCNSCILKMDHHCPYTGNCIGFQNYRYFYMFILYLWLGTAFYISVGYTPLFELYETHNCSLSSLFFKCNFTLKPNANHEDKGSLFLLSYFLCLSIFIVMCLFMSMHTNLLIHNQTTIEMIMSALTRKNRLIEGLRSYKYLYDLGSVKKNVQQVFGEKWWMAFLPIKTEPMGNGKVFELQQRVKDLVFSQQGQYERQQLLV